MEGITTTTKPPLHTLKFSGRIVVNRVFAVVYTCAIFALLYHHTLTLLHSPTTLSLFISLSMLVADFLLGFMWSTTQSFRMRPVYRQEFPENLHKVMKIEDFPGLDIFICTADPYKEPPMSVVNTALSVMAYDYPTEKISVYISDDGGSELTLFAFMEAANFATHWLPFCRDNNILERCPDAYFRSNYYGCPDTDKIKMTYEEMKVRVQNVVEKGNVGDEYITSEQQCQVFNKWTEGFTRHDHPSVIQVLLEMGKDRDVTGHSMPNLVYLSRQKSQSSPHNFKAGALNALLRVSAVMSNAPIVLTLDCDMYSNDPQTPHRVLCYVSDTSIRPKLGYIQFPQRFHGMNKNDIYGCEIKRLFHLNPIGMDGLDGPSYVGTGCFFMRRVFFGGPTSFVTPEIPELSPDSIVDKHIKAQEVLSLAHHVAGCNYENQTSWGSKMGFRYGSLVEDYFTGYRLQCEGWKSIFCHPKRAAFLGDIPISLNEVLSQNKRWSVGLLEVAFSRYSPLTFGARSMGPLMGHCYAHYAFWPIWSIPITIYAFLPQLAFLNGVTIFPKVWDPWFFLYVFLFVGAYVQDCLDFVIEQATIQSWWSDQRMWLIRGLSSYLFGITEFVTKQLGIATHGFNLTSKVVDDEQSKSLLTMDVHPGPEDPSVLTLQQTHRSERIWAGDVVRDIFCRRSEIAVRHLAAPDDRILAYIRQIGFYGVYRLGFIQYDWGLITALVERWRVETHTFHLPVGETTITLQDVGIILGLPVDGHVVTGIDESRSKEQWQALCLELLGFSPPLHTIDGSRLRLSAIRDHFTPEIGVDAPDATVRQMARCYCMLLIGGSLFPDKSGNKVSLLYLLHLRHFDVGYSWGSAALAYLYRELCVGTRPTSVQMGGPLILLQLWAWERFTHIRPVPLPAVVPEGGPLGCRWMTRFAVRDVPTHVQRHYRDQLDQMRPEQMVWQPYTAELVASLPVYCRGGQGTWMARCPLIMYAIVEWHHPDRVMRQFGMRQVVPEPCDTSRTLHRLDRRGHGTTDWSHRHRDYIELWDHRLQHLVPGIPDAAQMLDSDPYMAWYRRITRRLIGPPIDPPPVGFQPVGTIRGVLEDGVARMYEVARSTLTRFAGDPHSVPPEVMAALEEIRTIGERSLQAIHEDGRLDRAVPSSTVFVPRIPQPQPQPQPHQPQPQQTHPQADPSTPQPQPQADPSTPPPPTQEQADPFTPPRPIVFAFDDTDDVYRPFTPGGSVYRVSPIHDFSIPMGTFTAGPSSSSFHPPLDPISLPPASQLEEMVESLTQVEVEAEDMQVEARETTRHDTAMAETQEEGLTQAEPQGRPPVHAVYTRRGRGRRGQRGRGRGRLRGGGLATDFIVREGDVVVAVPLHVEDPVVEDPPQEEGRPIRTKKVPSCGTH